MRGNVCGVSTRFEVLLANFYTSSSAISIFYPCSTPEFQSLSNSFFVSCFHQHFRGKMET